MGTNNFLTLNAKNQFSITLEDIYDEDFYIEHFGENYEQDAVNEFLTQEYELLAEDYINTLLKSGYDACEKHWDDNRSFPGRYVAIKNIEIGNSDESKIATIIIKPLIRNGYYEGINFDYDYLIELSSLELPYGYTVTESGILYEVPKGYKTLLAKANRILAQELKKLESIFSEIIDNYK